MITKDTMTMQNIISRLQEELILNCENKTDKVKQKYATVRKKFLDLHLALDKLNDEIEKSN